jgi:hypothetical protein
MAHMCGEFHGKLVVRVCGNDVEIAEERSSHAADVKYGRLVPVLPSVPGTYGLTLSYLSSGHESKACVDAEANGSPLSIGSAHVSVVVAALVEIVIRVSTVSTVGVYGVDDYGGSVVGTCVSWVVGAMWVFKNIS